MDTRHMDTLFNFTMQDPELNQLFVERATASASKIMRSVLTDSIDESPEPNNEKLKFPDIRRYMMEVLSDHPEVTIQDFRKHPRLQGLKASALNQNLTVLKAEGKVKKTKRTIGKCTIWVRT
jgi:hypothetical protein